MVLNLRIYCYQILAPMKELKRGWKKFRMIAKDWKPTKKNNAVITVWLASFTKVSLVKFFLKWKNVFQRFISRSEGILVALLSTFNFFLATFSASSGLQHCTVSYCSLFFSEWPLLGRPVFCVTESVLINAQIVGKFLPAHHSIYKFTGEVRNASPGLSSFKKEWGEHL